jgi:ABC-type transport system involved in multi-copper enzyme maturation permease subunit
MITAIRVELLKVCTTRLTAGLLAVAAGLTCLVTLVEAVQSGSGGGASTRIPALSDPAGLRAVLTNTGFAMLVATVFWVTVATGEFRHRTATDTYLDEPGRTRVLTAKVVTAAIMGLLFGVVATIISTSVGLGVANVKGYNVAIGWGTIAGYSAGAVLGSGLLAAIGAVLGALVRGQLGALVAVFVWAMAVEQIVGGLIPSTGRFLPLLAATTMAGADSRPSMPPIPPDLRPLPPVATAVLLAAIAVLLVVMDRGPVRRDVL